MEAGEPGIVEFVRRLVFNALIGNADMHMKNWSLIYPDGRSAALAPAYDLLSTIAYIPDGKMALNLVRSKRFADLTVAAFTHFAGKARLPSVRSCRRCARRRAFPGRVARPRGASCR